MRLRKKYEPIIGRPDEYEQKLEEFIRAGKDAVYILSDFDNTITREYTNGRHTPSLIAEMSQGEYISARHKEEDKRMFGFYRAKELDPNLSIEEKSRYMLEWWDEHMKVMIEEGAQYEMFEQAALNCVHQFRDNTYDVFRYTDEHDIPFVVFSAGYGEMIQVLLDSVNVPTDHSYIVANELAFDEDGYLQGYAKEEIHVFNKDTVGPERVDGLAAELNGRTHVIIMGDSLGDLPMMEQFPHVHVLKIGFYNHPNDDMLQQHIDGFDVVIPDDGDMSFVLELLQKIG